jgi:hypothetical protein
MLRYRLLLPLAGLGAACTSQLKLHCSGCFRTPLSYLLHVNAVYFQSHMDTTPLYMHSGSMSCNAGREILQIQ